MSRFIDWLFRLEEMHREIGGVCAYRWHILHTPWFKVYVHKFVADDLYFHDHPKRFITIGLWGEYIEIIPSLLKVDRPIRRYKAPWLRSFPAEHKHRIVLVDGKPCWTLAVVGRKTREWRFLP